MRKGGRIEKGPAGQLVASQDPAASAHGQSCTTGKATTYTYDPSDTYVTGTTLPTPSSGVALSTSATYDLQYTGLPTSTSDPNTQTTKYTSYNSMLQPLTVTHPDGGTTQYDWYSDAYSIVQTQNSSSSTNNSFLLDGYGRPSRQALSNGQATNPWYLQDTCYNSMGQIGFKSYPYQGTAWSTPIVCTGPADTYTANGDSYTYDALGRLKTIAHADGTSIGYTYTGRATQVTDENGVSRVTQVDVFGRPTFVCEVSSATLQGVAPGSCGLDIAATGFLTTYAYSYNRGGSTIHAADIVTPPATPPTLETKVTQGAQTRTFATDLAGRTTSVAEPERGPTSYTYAYSGAAGLGLVVTRQRYGANQSNTCIASGNCALTTTTTQYDVLGRVVSITYNDGLTPAKTYAYDAGANWLNFSQLNLEGRLSSARAGTATAGTTYSYDAMGRVIATAQCVPSGCGNGADDKHFAYTYDWLGNLVTSTDGGGVMTTYAYTPANEVQSITSSANDATHPPNLVSSVKNGPFGPISYALGNGLSAYMSYDALGRLNGKWICNGPTPAQNCSGSSVAYSFTTNWQGQRLLSSTDSVLASGVYNYDDFNRLVLTNYNNGGYEFSEVYDRYGNRWQQNMIAGGGTEPQLSFNASNQMVGYSYDAAGNVANDGFHTYTWDAENNLLSTDNGQTDSYVRDALGRLVRANIPTNNNQQIEYFWSPSGQWDSEWNAANGSQWQGTYFWGSTPVAFYYADGKTHFEHQDWVNTERMRTSYNGAVETKVDSLPFGDGMTIDGPNLDPSYHSFGYLYDMWNNTYLVGARQYSQIEGRWLSPDPYDGSYDLTNPQTFNRYAYARNNPVAFTDPSGLCELCGFGDWYDNSINEDNDNIGSDIAGEGIAGLGVAQNFAGDEAYVRAAHAKDLADAANPDGYTILVGCEGPGSDSFACYPLGPYWSLLAAGSAPYMTDNYALFNLSSQIDGEAGWIGEPSGVAAFYALSAIPGLIDSTPELLESNQLRVDGPSAGLAYGNGRLFGVRWGSQGLIRVDYQQMFPGAPGPQWHVHLFYQGSNEGIRFPISW